MKRKIHQNVWGNWNGYEGTRKVADFGTDEQGAREWLADPVAYETEQNTARQSVGAKTLEVGPL